MDPEYGVNLLDSGFTYLDLFIGSHIVLNPHGIEPTFLNFDSWSPGADFKPIIAYNVLN